MAHWHNKDLWLKLLVQITCIIYWWNPVIYLLRDILSQSLEIKCDSLVCQNLNEKQKTEYLQTIIHTMQNTPETRINQSIVISNFINYISDDKAMAQRFELVYKYNFKRNKIAPAVLSLIIFLLTYSIVIQPVYSPDKEHYLEEGRSVVVVNSTTSYIIIEDGLYYLYTKGEDLFELTESQCDLLLENGITIINK